MINYLSGTVLTELNALAGSGFEVGVNGQYSILSFVIAMIGANFATILTLVALIIVYKFGVAFLKKKFAGEGNKIVTK